MAQIIAFPAPPTAAPAAKWEREQVELPRLLAPVAEDGTVPLELTLRYIGDQIRANRAARTA